MPPDIPIASAHRIRVFHCLYFLVEATNIPKANQKRLSIKHAVYLIVYAINQFAAKHISWCAFCFARQLSCYLRQPISEMPAVVTEYGFPENRRQNVPAKEDGIWYALPTKCLEGVIQVLNRAFRFFAIAMCIIAVLSCLGCSALKTTMKEARQEIAEAEQGIAESEQEIAEIEQKNHRFKNLYRIGNHY